MLLPLFLSFFLINAAAVSKEAFNGGAEIISVAHRGDWHSYPENSAEAVKAAVEYGVVSVDLKLTRDGKAVLMADDTTDRMVVNAESESVSASVSNMSFDEITSLYLRAENGGEDKAKTDCRVAGLASAIDAVGTDTVLMLNLKCEIFEAVYSEVKELNATEKVVFRFNTDSTSDIIKTTANLSDITALGNYQGNIIFLATSAVKNSFKNNMNTVELGSANKNGVLYDSYLLSRFGANGRAMVSMVNGRCGKRADNESGWDDLIKRGYTVIETDYPKQLSEYLARIDVERKQLSYYVELYRSTDVSPYTTDSETKFTSALTNAQTLCKTAGSLTELQDARYSLQKAFDELTIGEKKAVTLKFEFTFGRFAAVALCGAAFVASQIFLYKRKDKNKKAK